jgi:TrmH family RNA methyltransferase
MPYDGTDPLKPIKWYKDLAEKKGRLAAQAFLVEGTRGIKQIIANSPDAILEILSTEPLPAAYSKYPQRIVSESQIRSICSTRTPQETVAAVRLPIDSYSDRLPDKPGTKILLLEDVQDPGNVGTLIRSAVAFGFSGVILTEKCADHLSPKCVQSTAGTVLSLWIRRTARYMDLVESLKRDGYLLVSTDVEGKEDTSVLQHVNKLLLALGNEASGLSRELLAASDHVVRIPMAQGKAESLNVGACGAICMYLSDR